MAAAAKRFECGQPQWRHWRCPFRRDGQDVFTRAPEFLSCRKIKITRSSYLQILRLTLSV
jgi:hypothetical protein